MKTYPVGEHVLYDPSDTSISMVDWNICQRCHQSISKAAPGPCGPAGYRWGEMEVYTPYLPLFISGPPFPKA